MATKTLTCHIAFCDDCAGEYEEDYTPHWPTAYEAIDHAESYGDWWRGEALLLCAGCRDKPHAFIPGDLRAEDCQRCPNPEDEHDEIAAAKA